MPPADFSLIVTQGRTTVSLVEEARSHNERVVIVERNGKAWRLTLPGNDLMGVAIGEPTLAVWGGMSLFLLWNDGRQSCVELEEPIGACYFVEGELCIVEEITIEVLDLESQRLTKRFEHDDILLSSHWEGDRLVVEDLQNRKLVLSMGDLPPTPDSRGESD